MQRDTFDVPAFKFGLLVKKHGGRSYPIEDMIKSFYQTTVKDCFEFVPYEDFEGLTFRRLQDFFCDHEYALVCYIYYKNNDREITSDENLQIIDYIIFTNSNEKAKSNNVNPNVYFILSYDERIDDAIEKVYLDKINDDERNKDFALTFLERYIYKDKNKVLELIEKPKQKSFSIMEYFDDKD